MTDVLGRVDAVTEEVAVAVRATRRDHCDYVPKANKVLCRPAPAVLEKRTLSPLLGTEQPAAQARTFSKASLRRGGARAEKRSNSRGVGASEPPAGCQPPPCGPDRPRWHRLFVAQGSPPAAVRILHNPPRELPERVPHCRLYFLGILQGLLRFPSQMENKRNHYLGRRKITFSF